MSTFKVVITDYEYATLEPEEREFAGEEIEFVRAQCKTEEEVIAAAKDADGLLNQYAPITRNVIEQCPSLKVISRYGVGVNTIDVEAATEKGIVVANVPDYCMDEVSDHTLALLLSCARKTVRLNEAVKSGTWDYKISTPMYRLRDRVLGLIGFGRIPQNVAKKAQVFGLRILAYDPFVPKQVAEQAGVQLVDLDGLCQASDFISVHAPLTDATKGLLSDKQFKQMKKEAFVINTARGPIIDEAALIRALQGGEIAGAGLDVVEEEPIPSDSPLLKMDQVILNPHVAWYSEESQVELQRKAAENIVAVANGVFPTYLFNHAVKDNVQLSEKQ